PFDAALQRYVDFLTADGELAVDLEIDPAVRLAPDEQIELFRIVQEGLANVRKHANARHAHVVIGERVDGERFVTITDDGDGFEEWRTERGFGRAAGAVPDAQDPPELEIVRAGDAEIFEFEAISARGFGGERAQPVAPGTFHRPNPDPRMTLWLGRVEGEGVS